MKGFIKLLISLTAILSVSTVNSQNAVNDFAQNSDLKGALISIQISDLVTGESLQAINPDLRLCPASVWKLFTTSAALSMLGGDFQFRTILAYDGLLEGDTLFGNIYILGGGDPTLGSRFFDQSMGQLMQDWTAAINKAGIKYVEGNIVANSSHFQGGAIPRTRIWEDMGNYYGAPVWGLNINDNTYFIDFKLPDDVGDLAEIVNVHPQVPGLELTSEVVVAEQRGDQAYIFGTPESNHRTIRGTLPAGAKTYTIKGSLPDAPMMAAFQLREHLLDNGIGGMSNIAVEQNHVREAATLKTLATVKSPVLTEIIKQTNMRSDNLFAETLLLQLGVKYGDPTIEGGLKAVSDFYKKACQSNCHLSAYDGSGLSRFTAVSSAQVVDLLLYDFQQLTQRNLLLNQLPLAGKEGSLKWFGDRTNLEGNMRGKSGSMEGVRAYAGQMTAFSGRQLGFAVLVNNFDGSGIEIKEKIEHMLLKVYGDY